MKRLLATVVFLAAQGLASPVLFIQPSMTTVSGGETFTLDVRVSDVIDLYAYEFDLGFNPTVLSATSILSGPLLPSGGANFFVPGTVDNPAGTISATGDTLLTAVSGVSGEGILATVSFTALSAGSSTVNVSSAFLLDSSISGIEFTTQSATVDVTGTSVVIPEPSTFLLILAAVLPLAICRRRTRRKIWTT